jgi:hypothetical protein
VCPLPLHKILHKIKSPNQGLIMNWTNQPSFMQTVQAPNLFRIRLQFVGAGCVKHLLPALVQALYLVLSVALLEKQSVPAFHCKDRSYIHNALACCAWLLKDPPAAFQPSTETGHLQLFRHINASGCRLEWGARSSLLPSKHANRPSPESQKKSSKAVVLILSRSSSHV